MGRRTKAEMQRICEAMRAALEADHPMTVRQVFYRLASKGVIPKTENQYKNTVCRKLKEMRLDGRIPFGWISDNTRWMRKPTTHDSMEAALQNTARTYRRSLWNDLDTYVEVWLEKEALAGVLMQETRKWDVPLMVCRGYPSITFVHEAAEAIDRRGKPAFLYYFGDHDPSGRDISRNVRERLQRFAETPITFERVAVEPWQIDAWDLPTRPTKKSDSRAEGFEGESVEVDAIPSKQLRTLVRRQVERHVNRDELKRLERIEEAERETLYDIAENLAA